MEALSDLIREHEWYEIYRNYKPEKIAKILPFKHGMSVAYHMLCNKKGDDDLRAYAVKLLEAICIAHPKEWDADWKNDIFLGDAYYLVMRYDERYEACKRASQKVNPLPPPVLVSLAGCYLAKEPPVSIEDAEKLLKRALEQEKSIEAVVLMRGICKEKGDEEQFSYWDNVLQEVEQKGAYMKNKWPDFFDTPQLS